MSHYFDHAATTPPRPSVVAAYVEELNRLGTTPGNPSALHASGRAVRGRLETARETIANVLGAEPAEVIFTSGATEANNTVIQGRILAALADPDRTGPVRVAVSAIEHAAALAPARALAQRHGEDVDLQLLPVTDTGLIDLAAAAEIITPGTAVVSTMTVNNETGAIQPVGAVAELARQAGAHIHTDAVQGLGKVALSLDGVDAMSISGHKIGAPVGSGALLVRREVPLTPVISGGGQQRSVRSGTLDVAAAVALAQAVTEAVAQRDAEAARLAGLREKVLAGATALDGVACLVPEPQRAPHIAHVVIEGADPDALLLSLDSSGILASSGAACVAGVHEASHVLMAMGVPEHHARSALRLSLGHTTTSEDIDAALAALPGAVRAARAVGEMTIAKEKA